MRPTLPAATTRCPRCGQLLVRRSALLYCLYGCTREWWIEGGSEQAQAEYERLLASRPHPDLGHETDYKIRSRQERWRRRPVRLPRGIGLEPEDAF